MTDLCTIAGGWSLLILLALPKHRTDILGILRDRRDVIQLSLYGILGLLLCQYAYMTAISHSNAPTMTVLQNFALVLVMLYTCLRSRRLPTRIEAFALVLALSGVYLLATGGNPTQMVLSVPGLSWNLVSASAVALYILLPRQLLAITEPVASTIFSMLWLGTSLSMTDFLGFAAILSTIFLLTKEKLHKRESSPVSSTRIMKVSRKSRQPKQPSF